MPGRPTAVLLVATTLGLVGLGAAASALGDEARSTSGLLLLVGFGVALLLPLLSHVTVLVVGLAAPDWSAGPLRSRRPARPVLAMSAAGVGMGVVGAVLTGSALTTLVAVVLGGVLVQMTAWALRSAVTTIAREHAERGADEAGEADAAQRGRRRIRVALGVGVPLAMAAVVVGATGRSASVAIGGVGLALLLGASGAALVGWRADLGLQLSAWRALAGDRSRVRRIRRAIRTADTSGLPPDEHAGAVRYAGLRLLTMRHQVPLLLALLGGLVLMQAPALARPETPAWQRLVAVLAVGFFPVLLAAQIRDRRQLQRFLAAAPPAPQPHAGTEGGR